MHAMSSESNMPEAQAVPQPPDVPAELYNAVKQVLEKQQVLPLLRARLREHVLIAMEDSRVNAPLITELRDDPDRRSTYLVLLLIKEALEGLGLEHSAAVFNQEIGMPQVEEEAPLASREEIVVELKCHDEPGTCLLESMVKVMLYPDMFSPDNGQDVYEEEAYSSDVENRTPSDDQHDLSPPGDFRGLLSPHTQVAMEDNLAAATERSLGSLNQFLDQTRRQKYGENAPNYVASPTRSSEGFVTPTNNGTIVSPQFSSGEAHTLLSLDRFDSDTSFAGLTESWRDDVVPPMQVALHRVDFNGDPSPRREDDDQLFTFQVYLTVIDTDSMLGERPEMEQLAKLTTSIRYRFQDASPEAVAVPRACEWLTDNVLHIPNAGKHSIAVFSFVRKLYSNHNGEQQLELIEILGQLAMTTRSIRDRETQNSGDRIVVRFEAPALELLGMDSSPTPYEMRDDFVSQSPKLHLSASKYDMPSQHNWTLYAGIENHLCIPDPRLQEFYATFPSSFATTVTCRVQFPGQTREEKAFRTAWLYLVGDQMKIHSCDPNADEPIDRSQNPTNSIHAQHRIRFPRRNVHAIFCFKVLDEDAVETPKSSPGSGGQRKRVTRLPGSLSLPRGETTIQQENCPYCIEVQLSEPGVGSGAAKQEKGSSSPQSLRVEDFGRLLTRSESFNAKYKRIHLKVDSREAYQELVCALLTWSGLRWNVSPDTLEQKTRLTMQLDYPQLLPHSALVGWSAISATGSRRLSTGSRLDSLQETEEVD